MAERLPTTVRALGIVSLCTDLSSEMVYPLNPALLRALGAPPEAIGLIEGLAEAAASLLKLWSGALSDRLGRRKTLALVGYGLAALSKPILGAAGSWTTVLAARLLDRTGKGLRGAPRDALIADVCPPELRGRAYGLHRSLDTTGAVLGPLAGWLFLQRFPGQVRSLYLWAVVPAAIGVLVLALFVREIRRAPGPARALPTFSWRGLSPEYRRFLVAAGIFSLGNSSDAFLLLRAREGLGVGEGEVLLLYALFNVVEATLGYAAGRWADRRGRRPLIVAGWLVFAAVYAGFAWLDRVWAPWVLMPLYGLYYTLCQGASKALAADLAHPERRGAELGVWALLTGLATLPASLLAGWLYHRVGPHAPFVLGAATASAAAIWLGFRRQGESS